MPEHIADQLFTNGRIWTGRTVIDSGAIAARDGQITYVGPRASAPDATTVTNFGGRLVTPGLIDCHTHIVHAGNRANEWRMRLEGATYEAVAKAGGGIVSSVKAVRAASEDELVAQSLPRLDALLAEGVTTIEIKSGYGLDTANEIKLLRAARRLGQERAVAVTTTFLGAHAMPPGKTDTSAYMDEVIGTQLPAVLAEGLADAVDCFTEGIAFSVPETRRLFAAARASGLPVKIHAEQLSNLGGAAMAASEFGALSADHIEYLDEAGVMALAKAGTVAVLLPGAFYFIKEKQKPPVEVLRRAGVPIAVATDCNPGTSPMTSLLLAMNMVCTFFGLTPEEALLGVTAHAAKALGLLGDRGTLEVGKRCDLAVFNVSEPAELAYRMGARPLHMRVVNGVEA